MAEYHLLYGYEFPGNGFNSTFNKWELFCIPELKSETVT